MTKIRKSAKGEQCQLRFPGCRNETETVVLAHIRRPWNGGVGMKPNDLHSVYCCAYCHDILDGRKFADLSKAEKASYALDGHLRTLDLFAEKGLL